MEFELQREEYRQQCEDSLSAYADSLFMAESEVGKAARYSLLNGGKRVRGILVLSVCDLLGGNPAAANAYAAAIEMIHAFSLIHDDLPCMDDDDLRRGKPSTHIAFGQANALLAGDMLSIQAFETIAKADAPADSRIRAVQELSFLAGAKGMIYGQELDLFHENVPADEKALNQIHRYKTGALILAAIRLGCCTATTNLQQQDALNIYAQNIGLVFQIVDDILDITSSEEVLGKPIGSDDKQGKTTFVSLYGQTISREKVDMYTLEAIQALDMVFAKKAMFLTTFAKKLSNRLS